MRLEQPLVTGKAFMTYLAELARDLKALFGQIHEEAVAQVGRAGTFQELENSLVGLFEESPTDNVTEKAYKPKPITPAKYAQKIGRIIRENNQKAGESILAADQKRFEASLAKMRIKDPRQFSPDIKQALSRSSSIIKAADHGLEISRTRREEIRGVMKRVLDENPIQTRQGTVRLDIQKKVKNALDEYFSGYTKNSPPFGVPKNLEAIAVTETKSLISSVRREYMNMAADSLPKNVVSMKRWRHNASLSRSPRAPHVAMNGKEIPLAQKFRLGAYWIDGPYDPVLPASETIHCGCDLVYVLVKTGEE